MMFHELSGVWGISGWLKENYRSLTSPPPSIIQKRVMYYCAGPVIPCTQRYLRIFHVIIDMNDTSVKDLYVANNSQMIVQFLKNIRRLLANIRVFLANVEQI